MSAPKLPAVVWESKRDGGIGAQRLVVCESDDGDGRRFVDLVLEEWDGLDATGSPRWVRGHLHDLLHEGRALIAGLLLEKAATQLELERLEREMADAAVDYVRTGHGTAAWDAAWERRNSAEHALFAFLAKHEEMADTERPAEMSVTAGDGVAA